MAPRIEKDAIHAFAAELAKELNAPVDAQYSGHHWAFALTLEKGVRLFGHVENGKVEYSVYVIGHDDISTKVDVKCGVSMARGAADAAREIHKRLLPDAMPRVREVQAKHKEMADAALRVDYKAAALSKKYSNIKIAVDRSGGGVGNVRINTKYGAGVQFDGYAYEETRTGVWVLTSHMGRSFRLDDIDSKAGRAFLKLCNDN